MKAKDYTGQKFGKLTAIKFTNKHHITNGNNKKRMWLFECECGKQIERMIEKVTRGLIKSCGCLLSTRTPLESVQHQVFIECYNDSNLTEKEFIYLSQLNCWYCNCPPSNKRFHRNKETYFLYNGLDRIDNTRGHDVDNVVPCCFDCNQLKSNSTILSFLKKISTIYHNRINYEIK